MPMLGDYTNGCMFRFPSDPTIYMIVNRFDVADQKSHPGSVPCIIVAGDRRFAAIKPGSIFWYNKMENIEFVHAAINQEDSNWIERFKTSLDERGKSS